MSLLIDGLDRCRQAAGRLNDLEFALACPPVDCFLLPILHLLGQEPADTWEVREGWSKPRETLDTLRGYLSTNPDDTSVRYVVLGFLYALAVDPDDLDEWNDGYAAERQEFRDEFAEIARLPKLEELTEPKVVRWEIVNSCAARDFPRAERLYNRLDELQPERRGEHDALRGQFHFFQSQPGLHLGPDLLGWWPSLFKADFFAAAPSLARWGVALQEPLADPGAMRPHLRDAAYWFEKALEGGVGLAPWYLAVLARCLFENEQYEQAAKQYRSVLSTGLCLEGEHARFNDELKASAYSAAARSLERAGAAAAAIVLLEECIREFPSQGGAYRQLAELHANETDFQRAYEVLDKWAEIEPELESDVWVRTLRALGAAPELGDERRILDEFFNNHPERLASVREAVESHWSRFHELGEEAQKEWLYGCFRMWWAAPGFESVHWPDMVHHFTGAVEIELREKVFRPFLEEVKRSGEIAESLTQRKDRRAERWREWLTDNAPRLTLGDMITELDPSRKTDLRPWRELQNRLGRSFATLKREFGLLKTDRLRDLRNLAVHRVKPVTRDDAVEACQLCQGFLTALVSG